MPLPQHRPSEENIPLSPPPPAFKPNFPKPSTPPPAPAVEKIVDDAPALTSFMHEEETIPMAPAPQPEPSSYYEEPVVATPASPPTQIEAVEDYDENSPEELAEIKREQEVHALSDNAKNSARLLLERIMDDKSTEVLLNGPKNIMVKENGNRIFLNQISFDSVEEYHSVINNLILHDTDTADRIGATNSDYLIEGQLELPDYDNPDAPPLFARVHVLTPPVVQAAKVTIAKKAKRQFRLDDFVAKNTLTPQMAAFLKALSRGKATMVFSGLSGAGKTTLLEAISYEFDENDRCVLVEDTAELRIPVYDVVPLLSTSRKPGQNPTEVVTLEWLVAQANRMRPDRIIVGESRGGEFAEFLTAANSGADGSLTTIHASSPKQAIDKMRSLALKSSVNRSEQSITRDIASTIQVIVQIGLIDGKHVITDIEEVSDIITSNGNIALQPIFTYDRRTGRYTTVGQPGEKLTAFLSGRGVSLDRSWFARM